MATFYYTAKSLKGEVKSGTYQTKDKSSLARALRKEGYILTSAKVIEAEEKKRISLKRLLWIFQGVSLSEKLMFVRHLAVMIGAGFSLHRGLEVLARQTTNSRFKRILLRIGKDIKEGKSFGESLGRYPRIFDEFFVSMVRVGETGGNLEEVLKILANHIKREHDLKSKVRGAMIYPAVIVTAMIGIGILMMIMVVPKLTQIFEELKIELPFTTRMVLTISRFLSNYIFFIVVAVLILIFIARMAVRAKKGKKALGWFFLNTPILGKITKKINSAKFARSFSSLMASGIPIVEALNVTSRILTNVYYHDSLVEAAGEVKEGKRLQESLERYPDLYPALVTQMIAVGEETGELANILSKLADFYEEEVTAATQNLASVVEPILMIIVGAAVGLFAVSMIQPMYSLMEQL